MSLYLPTELWTEILYLGIESNKSDINNINDITNSIDYIKTFSSISKQHFDIIYY